jgi:Uma2 family endonuclease
LTPSIDKGWRQFYTTTMQELATFLPVDQKWPEQGAWRYEDYLNLPDDGRRYEIIEGVLYMAAAPSLDHQFVVSELLRQIGNHVLEQKLGYVLTAPFEVHLAEGTRPVQPDLLYIKQEHWPGQGAKFFEGAPDLVIEVLSVGTSRRDRVAKFTAYEQAGVPEYWIANPKTRSVEVFTLSGQEYALIGEFVGEDLIMSKVLLTLQIQVDSLFL